jgi:hypothetical protein
VQDAERVLSPITGEPVAQWLQRIMASLPGRLIISAARTDAAGALIGATRSARNEWFVLSSRE